MSQKERLRVCCGARVSLSSSPIPTLATPYKKAKDAGFEHIDICMSPCSGGKSATDQVDEMSKSDNQQQ